MTEPTPARSESLLQKKVGGVPVWLIAAAVGLGILALIYYRRKAATSVDTTATDSGTVSADTVPPFINQVYTQEEPPEASAPSSGSKTPSSGSKTQYALVRYYNKAYELGTTSGVALSSSWIKKLGGIAKFEKGSEYVKYGSGYYKLGGTSPQYLSQSEFAKLGKKAAVVTGNTSVNAAPGKVK